MLLKETESIMPQQSDKEGKRSVPHKRLFEPGTFASSFTGQTGIVLSQEQLRRARTVYPEGRRPGHYFAPGCCQNPDYVLQVPILFEDGKIDIMRAMHIRRGKAVDAEKQARLECLLEKLPE
jgi:hypothetical protein